MAGIRPAARQLVPLLMGTFFSVGACADSIVSADNSFELRLGSGLLNGQSGEYVYDAYGAYTGIPGYKISELNWELNDVFMVGLGATIPLGNWVDLNLEYWKNATEEGDGTMDDYDWLYIGQDWSDWSHHEDTVVRDVSNKDASVDINFYRFSDRNGSLYTTSLFGIAGYKEDHFDWQASGGYGIYSISSFRDSYVFWSDVPVISYEQTFRTPYVGLGIESISNSNGMDMVLNARVRYSEWAEGEDVDFHYPSTEYVEEGDGGEWISYDVSLEFEIATQLTLMAGYSYQKYQEIMATTVVTDQLTGTQYLYSGDAAGLDHSSDMLTLDLKFRF